MTEPVRAFFKRLAEQQQPLPRRLTGVVRVDLADGERTEHWYLDIRKSDVNVSHQGPDPDCTVSTDLATFAAIIEGRINAMAALLRGAVVVEGRSLLMAVFRKLLVAPITAPDGVESAGYARRQA